MVPERPEREQYRRRRHGSGGGINRRRNGYNGAESVHGATDFVGGKVRQVELRLKHISVGFFSQTSVARWTRRYTSQWGHPTSSEAKPSAAVFQKISKIRSKYVEFIVSRCFFRVKKRARFVSLASFPGRYR